MEIIQDLKAFQKLTLGWRGAGLTSAAVFTMGALHAGHFRLIEEGRRSADRLCASIFVNPTQFGPGEDFEKYPRTLDEDAAACEERGVDALFAPAPAAMYPGDYCTTVNVERMTEFLCGAHRPGHFRGVTTVVLKLLMLAQPSIAVFGWKDAQQFLVLKRMARDLNVPTRMLAVDTVREFDGLALSSRNKCLTPEERADAPLIYQGLLKAFEAFETGERHADALAALVRRSIEQSPRFTIQYAEARALDTLDLLTTAVPGNTLLAVAAFLGPTRLIDNIRM